VVIRLILIGPDLLYRTPSLADEHIRYQSDHDDYVYVLVIELLCQTVGAKLAEKAAGVDFIALLGSASL
jgi:hypothetical protein